MEGLKHGNKTETENVLVASVFEETEEEKRKDYKYEINKRKKLLVNIIKETKRNAEEQGNKEVLEDQDKIEIGNEGKYRIII